MAHVCDQCGSFCICDADEDPDDIGDCPEGCTHFLSDGCTMNGNLNDANPHELLGLLKERYADGTLMATHVCLTCKEPCGYYFSGGTLFYRGGCKCQRESDHARNEQRLLDKIQRDHDWAVRLLT